VLLKGKKEAKNCENKRRNVKFLFNKNLPKMAYLYGCLTL